MENLSWVLEEPTTTAEELEWEHRMDISASIYARMKEIGLNESELADRLGVDKSQVSRLINGKRNITLSKLAQIEMALDFRLDGGFRYYMEDAGETSSVTRGITDISLARERIPSRWTNASSGLNAICRQTSSVNRLEEAA